MKHSKYSCSLGIYTYCIPDQIFFSRGGWRGLGTPTNSNAWLFIASLPGILLSQFYEQKNVPVCVAPYPYCCSLEVTKGHF